MLNTTELIVARKRANLSQRDIAKALGCAVNTYNSIEQGKGRLTLDMIDKIIRVLHITDDADKLKIFLDRAS